MNYEQLVRQAAVAEGVNPDVLVSIWQQESGRGTDLNLRGQTIGSGRWRGHHARGPFQIMSFHGEIPEDFAGQARWAAKHLKDRGVAGYYGTGKAPAGHPTSQEYVAQVMNRVPNSSAPPSGVTIQASQISGDPSVYGGGEIVPISGQGGQPMQSMFPVAPGAMPGVMPMAPGAMLKNNLLQSIMANPHVQMGSAILGQAGQYNPAAAVGRGVQTAVAQQQAQQRVAQLAEAEQLRLSLALNKVQDAQAQKVARERLARQYDQSDPDKAAAIRAGGKIEDILFKAPDVEKFGEEDAPYIWDPGTGSFVPAPGYQPSAASSGPEMGTVKSGYTRTIDPETGQAVENPNVGTPEYEKRELAKRSTESALVALEQLDEIVRTKGEGLDLVGDQTTQKQIGVLYQELMAAVADLNNAGVLQPGEIATIRQGLPDPREKFTMADADAIREAYTALRSRIQRRAGMPTGSASAEAAPPPPPGFTEEVPGP